MELILLAIVICLLLAFYPIRVKPRPELIAPAAIATRLKSAGDAKTFFFDPANMPGTYKPCSDTHDGPSGFARCALCSDESCELCGSSDCADEFYICSWCSERGIDGAEDCPYCAPLYPGLDSRFRDPMSGASDHFSSDVFVSDDFDASFYRRKDYMLHASSFSDLAVHGQAETEVFYYEGKRYIAATYDDTLVIRPDF